MSCSERTQRIEALLGERRYLQRQLNVVDEELHSLNMLDALERYTCHCVNLNSKMGIQDSAEQERRNRNALQLGLVSETLSASRSCPDCGGTGRPRVSAGVQP